MEKILDNLCRIDGVRGALIFDKSGAARQQVLKAELDISLLGSLVVQSMDDGEELARLLGIAPVSQTLVEYQDLELTMEQLTAGYYLVILASTGANLGRIRLEIRKNRRQLESMVAS